MKNNVDDVISLIDKLMDKGNNHVNIKYNNNQQDTTINSKNNCEQFGSCMQPNESKVEGEE